MKKTILLLAIIAVIAVFAGCSKDSVPTASIPGVSKTVAVIDGLPITAKEYQTFLHENYGEQALGALAQEKIVEKWAKDEGVEVTPDQTDRIINQLKESGQYGSMVSQVGEAKFNKELKKEAMLMGISKKVVVVKEDEVKKIYDQIKDNLNKKAEKNVEIIFFGSDKTVADENYKALKEAKDDMAMYSKIKELKGENAKLQLLPQMKYDEKALPKEILDAAKGLKNGEMSTVSAIKGDSKVPDSTLYFAVKIVEKPAINKTFEDVKPDIENSIAMMNTRGEEFSKELEKRMKDAEIDIKIAEYKGLADKIKNPKPQMPGMSPQGGPDMGSAPVPAPGR